MTPIRYPVFAQRSHVAETPHTTLRDRRSRDARCEFHVV